MTAKKVAVITDANVDLLYGERVMNALGTRTAKKLVLPGGEGTKSLKYLEKVYDFLLEFGISRFDLIIALGGGVIGDLTGLAAATVLRGVPFMQIPTTLLAQVDSSVGGKVAINSPHGKNLIGAFHQPKAVLIDPDCLATLEPRVFSDGMAEVIKCGCIADAELFETLEATELDEVVLRCCDIKRQVVEQDEFDTGRRMILNFGHTIGHAVENFYNYEKYTHGEAVAIGMYNVTLAGERMGITAPGTAEKIRAVLKLYSLPYALDSVDGQALSRAMNLDKKSDGDMINMIFIEQIGKVVIKKLSKETHIL